MKDDHSIGLVNGNVKINPQVEDVPIDFLSACVKARHVFMEVRHVSDYELLPLTIKDQTKKWTRSYAFLPSQK